MQKNDTTEDCTTEKRHSPRAVVSHSIVTRRVLRVHKGTNQLRTVYLDGAELRPTLTSHDGTADPSLDFCQKPIYTE